MSYKNIETRIFFDYPEYVSVRDSLIPEAEEYANRVAGLRPNPVGGAQSHHGRMEIQEWGDTWSLVFHRKMDELGRKKGLVK